MGLSHTFQTHLADALAEPHQTSLHILRQSRNFGAHYFIENFDLPFRRSVYLKFEMAALAYWWRASEARLVC